MGEARRRKLLGLPPRKDKSKPTPGSVIDVTQPIRLKHPRRMTKLEVMLMMLWTSQSGTRLLSKLKKQP